ncbi:CopL family metal-binding regulatory protein [Pseudomaricurvus alkylphenolicus]|uniref:CopL family metal-binding regulatory protein n=1 Tax=Pseudomaricurvus alkylphenolicus TaxID=1306991 RepID=UPI0014228A33|nr:CopL family metal-binding regulatory protein [Pseudomaricurvus alkylphenolicus]NIB44711.1 CopL family metal-binding regulatory protein [Pseudomaricurvus alkylphenolicus]
MIHRRFKTLLVLSLLLTLVSQSLLASAIILCSHTSDQAMASTMDHGLMNHVAVSHDAMNHETMNHKAMKSGSGDHGPMQDCCDKEQCAVSLCSPGSSIAVGSLAQLPSMTMGQLAVVSSQGFPSSLSSTPYRPPIAG